MNYIVLDLEWNQGQRPRLKEDAPLFEIIEIGALKLDKDLFYFGNLIADIDYGNKLTRKDTHYNKNYKCKKS